MGAIHLLIGERQACGRPVTFATSNRREVTCKLCHRSIPRLEAEAAEAERLARCLADCEAVGLGWMWARFSPENPSERMLRELVAALARYVIETDEEAAVAS